MSVPVGTKIKTHVTTPEEKYIMWVMGFLTFTLMLTFIALQFILFMGDTLGISLHDDLADTALLVSGTMVAIVVKLMEFWFKKAMDILKN